MADAITNTTVGPATVNPATNTGTGALPLAGGQPANPVTPPPIVSLPKPQTTPTTTTGVASSSLANDTLQTQSQGAAGLMNAVNTQATNVATQKANNVPNPAVSIVDLLNSQGKPSDFGSRAQIAQQAGIQNYVGTANQNAQLIGYINNPPATTGGSTSSSTGSTSGSTTSGNTTGSTQATTPPIGSNPGDQYASAILQGQSQINSVLEQSQAALNQYTQGTLPLSSAQIAKVAAVQSQFDAIAEEQAKANSYATGVATEAAARSGGSFVEQTQSIQASISNGIQKLNDLQATAANTVATLQQSFMDKDYTAINDNYDKMISVIQANNTELDNLQKNAQDLYTFTQDYNQKAQEFQQSQAQSKAEFDATYAQNQAKFVAQYAGLIDPSTGLFKPSADPTTLPGITSLPPGIGSGAGGYYFDAAAVPDKSLATLIERQAKLQGYGTVDSSTNKTFNQSLSAFSGLNQAIESGAINGNDKISNDIGQKKSANTIQRIFGSTQPDDIQTVLGAGGASVPNLQNMTWNQAASYLQNSVYTAMGTNTVAQKYAMNPGLATTDLTSYYSASPANAQAVTKLMTANPNYTDSQVMQILTSQ